MWENLMHEKMLGQFQRLLMCTSLVAGFGKAAREKYS